MKPMLVVAAALALVALVGCQPRVVSPLVPLPLPIEPAPSTKLTIVGTGETLEQAREVAINQMVHQVIMPPAEPEDAPTAEFVDSLIRGYNVAQVAQDFLGKYYVTVELTISQLGVNYQELYHKCQLHKRETELLKTDIDTETKRRQLSELKEEEARKAFDAERKSYEERLTALQARIDELSGRNNRPSP